ncbi:MAG: gamma-glutamylcyclotransferase family protein [Rhizobiaceae bacterium]
MKLTYKNRLVTYGTLAPGRVNHDQLAGLAGRWLQGTVRGRLMEEGWGADLGCPGIIMQADGDIVEVDIFESADLPDHWTRLDAFEGDEYQRTKVKVVTDAGEIDGYIYELAS